MIKLCHERRPKFCGGTWRAAMKLNKGDYAVLWFMEDIHAAREAVAEFRCSGGGISTLSIASWYDSLEVYELMVNYSKMHQFFFRPGSFALITHIVRMYRSPLIDVFSI